MPAHETATVVGSLVGQQTAGVGASLNVQCAARHGHDAAMGAIAIDFALYIGTHLAVGDAGSSEGAADESCSKLAGGVDAACHLEVLDGSILGDAERCRVLFRCVIADGQRLAIAQEGALERVGLVPVSSIRKCR